MELAFNSTEASKETVGRDVIGSTEMDGLKYARDLNIFSNQPVFCSKITTARRILLHKASIDLMPRRSTYKSRPPLQRRTAS